MTFVSNLISAQAKVSRQFLYFALYLMMLNLFFPVTAGAASLPPNVQNSLTTQAEISFYAAGNLHLTYLSSNIVSVDLLPVQALAFSYEPEISIQPGQQFSIPLILHNKGNVATPYTLALSGDLSDKSVLIRDINGNGRKDIDDFEIGQKRLGHLEYAGRDALILTGIAPPESTEGSSYQIEITAFAPDADIIATASLKLSVSSAPQMQLSLEASLHSLDLLDSTIITASAINSGAQALQMHKEVIVDGQAKNVTLLRYRIPAGLRFVDDGSLHADLKSFDTLLFSTSEDSDFHYRSRVDPADVREIALAVGSALASRESRKMVFTLQLADNEGESIISKAEGFDDASLQAFTSNVLTLDIAGRNSADIVPHIVDSGTAGGIAIVLRISAMRRPKIRRKAIQKSVIQSPCVVSCRQYWKTATLEVKIGVVR
jgi:hypothetical protein